MKDEDELIRKALGGGTTGAIAVAEIDKLKVLTEPEMFDWLLGHAEKIITEFGQMPPTFHAISETSDYICALLTVDSHEQRLAGCFGLKQLFEQKKVTEYYFALEGWFWQGSVGDSIKDIDDLTPETVRELKNMTRRECIALSHIMYGGSRQVLYEIKRSADGKTVSGFEKMLDESFGIGADTIGEGHSAQFKGIFADLLP